MGRRHGFRPLDAAVFLGISVFLLPGLYLLGLGVRNVWRGFASTGWPTATGKVIPSERIVSSGEGRHTVSANIAVSYAIDGREYTTTTVTFGQTGGSSDTSVAELLRLRFPTGAAVPVSYDPSDPAISALDPGFHIDALWLPGAALIFVLIALLLASAYLDVRSGTGVNSMGVAVKIFAGVFLMIGAPMLISGAVDIYRGWASGSWPTTRGQIVYQQAENATPENAEDDGNVEPTLLSSDRLIYRYDVGGRTYFSNQRRFGQSAGSDGEWITSMAKRYPRGAQFNVAYNPVLPTLAVLDPGVNSEAFVLPAVGAAFSLFGLVALLFIGPRVSKGF